MQHPQLSSGIISRPLCTLLHSKPLVGRREAKGMTGMTPTLVDSTQSLRLSERHCKHTRTSHLQRQALRSARSNVQREVRLCINEYWSDLSSNIQQAADTGNINSMFEGIKKATGPKISKTAPIKSKAGTIIADKTKQLERWVEHYSELYSRENIVHQSVLDAIDRLPQMPVLDEPPPLEELSKAIDKAAIRESCREGWYPS